MVKRKAYFWFGGIMAGYFIVRTLRTTCPELPDFVRFHLTDLLFVPAMSLFALILIRKIKKDDCLRIPFWTVLLQVVLVSIYFEYYLPVFRSHVHPYTSDPIDVVMYFLGGFLFMALQWRI